MKIFWTLLVLVVGAGVAFLAFGQGPGPAAKATTQEAEVSASTRDVEATPQPSASESPRSPVPEAAKPAADAGPSPATETQVTSATPASPVIAPPAPAPPEAGDAIASDLPDQIDGYLVTPVLVQHNADGSTTLDATYTLKGDGTKANPYDITWEMLTSAQQTFDPKAGKKKIPGVVAFLHRKFVRVRGYIAFPLQVKEPRELLSMLNQWDGCCIGVPPTPYDAIEVNLTSSVAGNARFATSGSVAGKFLVKPYVTGDWLVGLYVMNQGTMDSTDFGGKGGGDPANPNSDY